MAYSAENRKYQRCVNLVCKGQMSIDGKRWEDFEMCDISAGGLKLVSGKLFQVKTPLHFKLKVYNMLSEFNLRFEGHVTRIEMDKGKREYAVRFDNIDKYSQIQLDEVIKSRVTLVHSIHSAPEDGSYTFLLMPRVRMSHLRNRMRIY
jgi:hypothetical protein